MTFSRMFFGSSLILLLSACRIDMQVANSDGSSTNDKVTSLSNTINCTEAGGDCTQSFRPVGQCTAGDPNCTEVGESGLSETYAAVPQDGNSFAGWGAGCPVGASFCSFNLTSDNVNNDNTVTVEADFTSEPKPASIAIQRYNHRQQRVRKDDIRFVYDPQGHLLGEYRQSDNSPIREYVWLDNHLLSQFDYTKDATNPTQYYYINDHLGTPQYMIDRDGNPVYELAMGPFGENYGEYRVAGITQPLRFAGQYYDRETGMHQNWHREYAPNLGRYLQSDPIGLRGGINTYIYAYQNPVKNVDPLGLEVTMTCRPVATAKRLGLPFPQHCGVIVWHWQVDPCTNIKLFKVIDAQYSLERDGTSPTKNTNSDTYTDDRGSFNDPNGNNHDIPVPPIYPSQKDFDDTVRQNGDSYSQGAYNPYTGPNSNTASTNIVQMSGGNAPNIPTAWGQNMGN